jgi:hypothetical protein
MEKFEPSNIRMLEVKTLSFSADSTTVKGKIITSDDLKQYDYMVGYQMAISGEEEVVRIMLKVEILGHVKGLKRARKLGEIVTESFFYLLDYEEWLMEREDKSGMRLDEFIVSTLVGLAFSTTRGILLARAAGTVLEDAIMPVIDPARLLEIKHEPK